MLFHYRTAIVNKLQNNSRIKNKLLIYTCPLHVKDKSKQWTSYLNTLVKKFIYFLSYERVSYLNLDFKKYAPKFIPYNYAN